MARPQISVQLYSVHQALVADVDDTLRKLAEIGLTSVEAFDFVRHPEELKAALDRHGHQLAARPRADGEEAEVELSRSERLDRGFLDPE